MDTSEEGWRTRGCHGRGHSVDWFYLRWIIMKDYGMIVEYMEVY
jgi:hypothetical protein